ncbi:receptor-interacting serine/threonine-protein kinase 2 [Alligator mississippiensis]|uniref:Receptor-interacting serine/threonine-protein kinase 2 n=1 Tax=Alligator mississippiensis TaxID=8496 RepID=A0A151MLL0_ALLMI|nr:receptor-interacting serine/threonine-protein kinase 2 [Alligator mississippiensis]KYO25438.1 receptor-interacting serine/threonine-protein kinase 2 [Alligator mississippiensis]
MLVFLEFSFPNKHQEMANPMPITTQEDLSSLILTRRGSGFALKAFHVPWKINISVKLLTSQNTAESDFKLLLQDIANTRRIRSEHLLPSLGIYQSEGLLGIVTEWACNGSLQSLIHEHHLYPDLPFPVLIRILSDVANGLNHLHSLDPPLLHYSLKPSNVVLDEQYRAKITDYGLTYWRKKQLRSTLENCSNRSCWDIVYLSPEILKGGYPSQEADIYSFGMMCWESLSRQKPFEGKKTLLKVVTGVCSGQRPVTEAEFIPSSLPQRNRLLHLIILCWHQEPYYRPHMAECAQLLRGILSTFSKEMISNAIYSLTDTKESAVNACKGSDTYTLQIDVRNLELINAQKNSNWLFNKRIPLIPQSLSTALLDSNTDDAGREDVNHMALADTTPQSTRQKRGYCNRKSNLQSSSSTSSVPNEQSEAGVPCHKKLEAWPHQPRQLPKYNSQQAPQFQQTETGPCYKGHCCQILACGREAILSCMTEGRLNHILDVLRSQHVLSRTDYETISSFPTLTGRTRALLDTCLCLGEGAAQTVATVLSANKCCLLAQGSSSCDSLAKINRLLQ